jgi:tetratricopeptide (TPR) repeat protein
MLQSAQQAWIRRDFQQNINLLERASRMDPANWTILMQLGKFQGLRYNYPEAETYFERAIRLAPRKAEAMALAAMECTDFRKPEFRERYLLRAVEQKDATPEMLARLANHYAYTRQPDAANALVERALHSQPNCARALLVRAALMREAHQLPEAEKTVHTLLPGAIPEVRVRGFYELGTILDRQGRYDEAMEAFLQAKAVLRPVALAQIADLARLRERLKVVSDSLIPETLRDWSAALSQLAPERRVALLGGHPRSGTTLFEQILDSHPDIISAEETETFHDYAYIPLLQGSLANAYLPPPLQSATPPLLRQSRDNYFNAMEQMFGEPIGHRLLIDKNPSLTFMLPAYVRIFPEAKYLMALRDPRDVCLSCFMQPFVPVGQVSSAYLTMAATVNEYAALMNTWRRIEPMLSGRYLEVRYENLVNDLESESRRALNFLGAAWEPVVLQFNEHARNKTVRSPTYADVIKPIYKTSVGRWRNYQKYLDPHLEQLASFTKAFGYE